MHNLAQLDKETERLFQLLKVIQANKNKADTVWENFCKDMNKNKSTSKKYFHKHPKNLSNSSSEILSPRPRADFLINRDIIKAKSNNAIKFAEPIADASDDEDLEIDDDCVPAVEVVTIREEYPSRKSAAFNNERMVKLYDRSVKDVRIKNEKSLTNTVTKRKSSKELKNATLKSKDDDLLKENIDGKLQGVVEKCLHCMEDIRLQLDVGVTPADGLEDLERRKKRSAEFASRFSRNYLYQLNRYISNINKIFRSPSAKSNPQNIYTVKQKLTWSYQTIVQGLQAYLTHLPVSTTIAVPDKIKELLKEVPTLCDIQRSCANTDVNSNAKNNELVDILEVRSRSLIEKIGDYYTTASAVSLPITQSKFSLLESSKARKNSNVKSRYAMYNGMPPRMDVYWKRAAAALAKKKYNVQSKYRTAYFKHRPPVEKQTVQKPAIKARPIEKKSSTVIKAKPTIDDDNIKTMMEIEREKYSDGKDVSLSVSQIEDDGRSNDSLIPMVEKLVERLKSEKTEVTQDQVRSLLRVETEGKSVVEVASRLSIEKDSDRHLPAGKNGVEDEELVEKLVEVIRKHQVIKGCNAKDCEEDVRVVQAEQKKRERERKQTITISGAKNAQLICIKDDSSIIEPADEVNDDGMQSAHPKEAGKSAQSHQQRLRHHEKSVDRECGCRHAQNSDSKEAKRCPSNGNVSILSGSDRASKIKISRLPKVPLQPLKMLPKKFALNILEYKINYLKARKGDHMYQKSRVKQPWILMGEISDKILDELLESVGTEIEVNHVIEGIYASEFA